MTGDDGRTIRGVVIGLLPTRLLLDEGREGDGHDRYEGVLEESDGEEHDDGSLVDGFPHPDKEGLGVERPSRLQSLVENGILEAGGAIDVFVEDKREYRQRRVDG